MPDHKVATLLALVVLLATTPAAALADGYLIPEETGTSSLMADQQAIILHRPGQEDLIISVGLRLEAGQNPPEMAWLIPVPSQPQVQTADRALFDELDRLSAPEIVYHTERRGGGLFPGFGDAAGPPLAVEVLERKQVGVYDVAVLAAGEGGGLLAWLQDEGFSLPGVLEPAVAAYAAEGWTFVAMRLSPDVTPGEAIEAQPIWLSFQSEQIVYPMRLTAAHGQPLALRLYILADHRYRLDDFNVEFAGPVEVAAPSPAMTPLLAGEFYLTKLFNPAVSPAAMAEDFYPRPASRDDPYREQIVYTHVTAGSYGSGELLFLCGGCWLLQAILLMAILVVIALLRRRGRKT
jgi:hypothetical protein